MGLRKAVSLSTITAVLCVIFVIGFQNCGNVSLSPHKDLPSYARNVVMTVDYSDSAIDSGDGTHKRRSLVIDDELRTHTVSMYFDDSLGNFEQRPYPGNSCPVRNPPNPTYFSINFRNNVTIVACTYSSWDGASGNCPAWYTSNVNAMIPLVVNTNRYQSSYPLSGNCDEVTNLPYFIPQSSSPDQGVSYRQGFIELRLTDDKGVVYLRRINWDRP